jgi:NodT family efflux transporter outer membrane factor (OMF) lipoprotein
VLLLTVLAASLVACAPKVRERPAPVAVPGRFAEPPPVVGEAEPLPDRWWVSFRDPVLDRLVERALKGNLTLRSAWDRLAQADASARRAGAFLLPSLDADAGASRTRAHTAGAGNASGTSYSSDFSLGLSAGYEVDLWGRIRASRDAARVDLAASREDLRTAAMTLSAQVASAWYELVEQYGQLELLQRQIATNERVLELTTLRFRRGQAGAADVLQQRQLVESTRGDMAQVEARAAVLEHALAILLGHPPEEGGSTRVSGLVVLPPLPAIGLPADLIRRRPDVRGAYYRVAAADRRVAAAIAERYPRVSLAAAADTSGGAVDDLFRNWFATLAANLVSPIFDGGLRAAEVERTQAAASEAFHGYAQTVLDALGEVEDALVQERRQRERIASLERQLELSAQVMERVRDRYTSGAVDYLRVLDALLTHQQLQRTRLTARRELLQQRIALCRALGGGWALERPEPILARGDGPEHQDLQ